MSTKLNGIDGILRAVRQANNATDTSNRIRDRLSSGLRISRASDDAAGLSIATSLNTDARIYSQAIRNIDDGISVITIADSALESLQTVLLRQQELAQQAANSTLSSSQRTALDREASALTNEFNRIVQSTTFNGIQLFNSANSSLSIQSGYGTIATTLVDMNSFLSRTVGTGTFTQATSLAIGAQNQGNMASADFDKDGDLDVVTSNSWGSSLSVMLNNGSGSFTQSNIAAGSNTSDVSVGDFNGDGNIDIMASVVGGGSDNRLAFIRGNGNGTFQAATFLTVGANPTALAVGDINNDGILDTLSTSGSVPISSGFTETTLVTTSTNGVAQIDTVTFPSAASLTNGGYFTLNSPSTAYYVWMNIDGTGVDPLVGGRTGVEVSLLSTDTASDVASKVAATLDPLGDINSSSVGATTTITRANLGVASISAGNLTGLTLNTTQVGSNQNLFSGQYFLLNSTTANYYVWFNVDGGGGDPLVGGRTGIQINVSSGQSANSIAAAIQAVIDPLTELIATLSTNQVTIREISSADVPSSSNVNAGGITVSTPGQGVNSAFSVAADTATYTSHGLATGDQIQFTTNFSTLPGGISNGTPYFAIFVDANTFRIATSYANALSNTYIDITTTGINSHFMTTPTSSIGGLVSIGNGNGTFKTATPITLGGATNSIKITDINNDGLSDILSTSGGTNQLNILLGTGNGTFASAITYATGTYPFALDVGDFNRDGIVDVAYANYGGVSGGGTTVGIRLGNGNGTFGSATNYTTNVSPRDLAIADLNGDNVLDIVTSNITGTASILIGNSNGTFKAQSVVTTPTDPRTISIGDYTGDSIPDLITAHSASQVLTVNRGNSQQASTVTSISLLSRSAALDAIGTLNTTANRILSQRTSLGVSQSRLEANRSVISQTREQLLQASSTILDVDYADEIKNLVQATIRSQIATKLVSMYNLNSQLVLKLLSNN